MIHIISPYESKLEGRGTRNIFIAEMLQSYSEVCFVTTNFSHQRKTLFCPKYLIEINEKYKVKIIESPIYKKNISLQRMYVHWIIAFRIFGYLFSSCEKGDAVYVSSIPPEILFLVSFLRYKEIKIILDVRDLWPEALPSKTIFIKYLFNLYCKFLYFFTGKVDKIFYTAPSFLKMLNRYKSLDESPLFVPLGYDENRWVNAEKKLNGLDSNLIKFVYVGSLETQCPLFDFLNATHSMANVLVDIIGDGDKLDEYKKIAGPNVKFHGRVSPDNVQLLISKSDFGVLPFIGKAAMPNKVFDYIGAYLPIFSIGNSDVSSFVDGNQIGCVADFDEINIRNLINSQESDKYRTYIENLIVLRPKFSKTYIYKEITKYFISIKS